MEITVYRAEADHILLTLVLIMLALGTLMVCNASYVYANEYKSQNSYHYLFLQLQMAGIGLAAMLFIAYFKVRNRHFIDYEVMEKYGLPLITAAAVASNAYAAIKHTRWIVLPIVGNFQPSEILKLAVIFVFAYYICKNGDKMKKWKYGALIPVPFMCGLFLIMRMQSHLSGLIIIGLICYAMMIVGESPKIFLILVGAALIGAVLYAKYNSEAVVNFLVKFSGRQDAGDRITYWIDPYKSENDGGYQIIQSLIAIGSGGLTGLGLGQSMQKHLYLPEPQNDFIFSIICEELGFVGAVFIVLLFALLIWRGFVIAYRAPNRFSSLIAMGITMKVAIQFLLNIAVVTNALPNTGISLPFFSYGGTALVVLMAEMGIILSISRYSYKNKAE